MLPAPNHRLVSECESTCPRNDDQRRWPGCVVVPEDSTIITVDRIIAFAFSWVISRSAFLAVHQQGKVDRASTLYSSVQIPHQS
jgi:hypothetical protein